MAYASKYYDPVKAHEYYMKHRQLKGKKKKTPEEQATADRKSTKSLNDEGKAAAKQIKAAIQKKRRQAYRDISDNLSDQLAALREQMKLEGYSTDEIKEKAEELRAQAKEAKEQAKAQFEEEYLKELDQLKSSGQFQKLVTKRVKRGKKSKKKSTSKKKRKTKK